MQDLEKDLSFKGLFIPFTTFKAIHWLVVVGLIVYFNVLFNGFVWDDFVYFLSNPAIKRFDLFSFFGVNQHFNGEGFYRPLPAHYLSLFWNLFHDTAFFIILLRSCFILHAPFCFIFS